MENNAAKIDFRRIAKLPPDKRIEALHEVREEIRKLVEEKKREIEEAEELLQRAEDELRVLLEIETPKVRQIKVEELFGREEESEKEETVSRSRRRASRELESIAKEAPALRLSQEQQQYASRLAMLPAEQLYNRISEFYREARSEIGRTGIETAEMRARRETLFVAVEEKKEIYQEKAIVGAATAWEGLTRAEQMLKTIQYGRIQAPPQEFYKR